jgi:hypothetical protein
LEAHKAEGHLRWRYPQLRHVGAGYKRGGHRYSARIRKIR